MQIIKANWPAPENIHAYTTTRHTWGEPGQDYKSQQARNKLTELLQLNSEPFWLDQIHSNLAVECTDKAINPKADASLTNKVNQVCLVMTADCLPILLCANDGSCVAAIHAGWRGLASGIVESTVTKLRERYGTKDYMAWLGPAIGPLKFEVGNDVYHAFTENDAPACDHFTPYKSDKWLANLYGLARMRLQRLNINDIYGGDFCTHTDNDNFFSYRRDGAKTGRMATLVWIGNS